MGRREALVTDLLTYAGATVAGWRRMPDPRGLMRHLMVPAGSTGLIHVSRGAAQDPLGAMPTSFGLNQLGTALHPDFQDPGALKRFERSDGWEVRVDGWVSVVEVGVAGEIDTRSPSKPVIGFVFGEQGLMAKLSREGAKITKLDKS